MARAKFRTIVPKLVKPEVFEKAFEAASREMEKDVKGAFEDFTANWKHVVTWRGYVRINADSIYISVGTTDPIFKYVDEGTVPHIIRPSKAKVLRWSTGGETFFAKEVHHPGTKAQKISESIRDIWAGSLMYDYFERALRLAVQQSGHAI